MGSHTSNNNSSLFVSCGRFYSAVGWYQTAASFIATPLWVLTGKKGPFRFGIPAAGVAEDEIKAANRFGIALRDRLISDQTIDATVLRGLGAVRINENLIASERVGTRSFYLWGKLFLAIGDANAWGRKPKIPRAPWRVR